ncbi:MAG: 3-phosphoshikimate 1-carboxyvinyltransferase [Spirochaetaceae bacterium]|jgi:3-phosphoshikimate 1-carboxyvinyltransferase|nr:3-phosphoshikimate 1-carboxyvinyltransferase [Spirochaetaceae bacterium]
MNVLITPHRFSRVLRIPASKSHTIRRLLIAALGEGVSEIAYPLDSLDTRSCAAVCRVLGVEITGDRSAGLTGDGPGANPPDGEGKRPGIWTVRGIGTAEGPAFPPGPAVCDVGNSGTTLFLALAAAALGTVPVTFTGDEQIGRRGAGPLLDALAALGVKVSSRKDPVPGCTPITVEGPWKGGRVTLPCPTSQYLSALLLAAPLAPAGTLTEIEVPLLNEKPYVELTLSYLKAQGIPYEGAEDFSFFRVPGGGSYRPLNGPVPGDFSSAAFPAAAAAITGGPVSLLGLDPADPQGDKAFFDILSRMGCEVTWTKEAPGQGTPWRLTVSRTGPLRGGEFDLNATPDLLPALAAVACYARGKTALVNVAHARIKETDRIAVMTRELGRLGGVCEETPDGLIIRGSGTPLGGGLGGRGPLDSRGDHRVVMALAVAALGAEGPVEISGAESAAVTYPGFLEILDGTLREENL